MRDGLSGKGRHQGSQKDRFSTGTAVATNAAGTEEGGGRSLPPVRMATGTRLVHADVAGMAAWSGLGASGTDVRQESPAAPTPPTKTQRGWRQHNNIHRRWSIRQGDHFVVVGRTLKRNSNPAYMYVIYIYLFTIYIQGFRRLTPPRSLSAPPKILSLIHI